MGPAVRAHQLQAEQPTTVERTPDDYAAHVREMAHAFGPFTFVVDELLAEGDSVYARWTQSGHHLGEIEGFAPTGLPLVEIGSAVYRVAGGRIVEYWIQIDRQGLRAQLSAH
jgi:predicted ester cyclase